MWPMATLYLFYRRRSAYRAYLAIRSISGRERKDSRALGCPDAHTSERSLEKRKRAILGAVIGHSIANCRRRMNKWLPSLSASPRNGPEVDSGSARGAGFEGRTVKSLGVNSGQGKAALDATAMMKRGFVARERPNCAVGDQWSKCFVRPAGAR